MSAVGAEKVIVRRHWNTPEFAQVSATSLWGIHLRNEPGGVYGIARACQARRCRCAR
jgi:hypothetical protein